MTCRLPYHCTRCGTKDPAKFAYGHKARCEKCRGLDSAQKYRDEHFIDGVKPLRRGPTEQIIRPETRLYVLSYDPDGTLTPNVFTLASRDMENHLKSNAFLDGTTFVLKHQGKTHADKPFIVRAGRLLDWKGNQVRF